MRTDVLEGKESDIPEHFDDASELIILTRTRKKWQSQKQLHGDTTQRPHVNRSGVRHS